MAVASAHSTEISVWRSLQVAVWSLGAALCALLLVAPALGLHLLWDVLIPAAPALFVFAPGIWRNICPLATTGHAVARVVGRERGWRPGPRLRGALALGGVGLLLAVVPLRHVVLDRSGLASALCLVAVGALALVLALAFDGKSGWCAGLCPVHGVEKLYGLRPVVRPQNAHCTSCSGCSAPCPDTANGARALTGGDGDPSPAATTLLVGGFPGFVWGWFQVRDYAGGLGWQHLGVCYAWPFAGLLATLGLYLLLRRRVPEDGRPLLHRAFAAAAVGAYYWYRLPALVGFGPFPGDGMLWDLTAALPGWAPWAARVVSSVLLLGWLLSTPRRLRPWQYAPLADRQPLLVPLPMVVGADASR